MHSQKWWKGEEADQICFEGGTEHHIGLWPICIEVKNEDSIHKSELLSSPSLLEFILWLIGY